MNNDTTLLLVALAGLFLYMQSQKEKSPAVIYQQNPTPLEGSGAGNMGEVIGGIVELAKVGANIYRDYRTAGASDFDYVMG